MSRASWERWKTTREAEELQIRSRCRIEGDKKITEYYDERTGKAIATGYDERDRPWRSFIDGVEAPFPGPLHAVAYLRKQILGNKNNAEHGRDSSPDGS